MKKFITLSLILSLCLGLLPALPAQATSLEDNLKNIVKIGCGYIDETDTLIIESIGSGVIENIVG